MSPVVRGASFSRDRRFRYRLTRTWDESAPPLVWVMLNPSAADTTSDDPTTRRVIGLSRSWGFGGCHVVNLFGYRTHRPRDLAAAADPLGPGNRRAVAVSIRVAEPAGMVMVAWGRHDVPGVGVGPAAAAMLRRIRRAALRPVTVGCNADGSPRHPLYVAGAVRPVDYVGSG